VTDKLAGYSAPCAELPSNAVHRLDKGVNNRAENSHQSTRERERGMRGFKSARQARRFLFIFGMLANPFGVGRYFLSAPNYRVSLSRSVAKWRDLAALLAVA